MFGKLFARVFVLAGCFCFFGCSEADISFSTPGALMLDDGKGSFRFGTATAAAQIEDGLLDSDWQHWSKPAADGGRGEGADYVGDAVLGFSRALDDVSLLTDLGLDAYRFSVDWSRIEPRRDDIDLEGIAHYRGFLERLVANDIIPMVTVHHFSSPLWAHDFLQGKCSDDDVPTDDNLCGWGHPQGGDELIAEIAEFAGRLAREYGDLVDEWCSLNEPINYIIASYAVGQFPPGEALIIENFDRLMSVYRNYVKAHVAIYDAIKANDLVDADGDGVAAQIGLSLNAIDWVPSSDNKPSTNIKDVRARDRVWYFYHHFFVDSLVQGTFDTDLDSLPDEEHPEWQGKIDWLGVQYYSRNGVTGAPALMPGVDATLCVGQIDLGSCLPPKDPTHWIDSMHYEYHEEGVYNVLTDIGARYPDLPLVMTESGIASNNGRRRAEHIVRTLEQTVRAMNQGVDVRGYYHWSLMDNFEWSEGYLPRFGLYEVDRATFERRPTEGALVYRDIIRARGLSAKVRDAYGGTGPMTPDNVK